LQIFLEQLPFIITQISNGLVQTFPILLETVKNLFVQVWDYIALELLGTEADFSTSFGKIKEFFAGLWTELKGIWDSVGQPIWDLIQECVSIVRDVYAQYMPEIKEFVSGCFTDIQNFWNKNLKPCLDAIGKFIKNTLAPIFKTVFETYIKGYVETAFNFIKSMWNDTLKPVFTGITDFLTGVFTLNFKQAWNGIQSFLKGIFNGIINGIEKMINGAIDSLNALISGINKAIKLAGSLLGLNVSIPTMSKLKLPRLEEGGILEKGQVGLLEGNGAEAVVPLDRNSAWISAVARDMQGAFGGNETVAYLQKLTDMLADYFPQVIAAAGHDIVTNDGAIVARYAPMMNAELGRISNRKDRGR
jgi:phage-related protein